MRDQAKIDEAQKKIEDARTEVQKAQNRFSRIYNAQKKIIEAEEAKEEMTLERALMTYFPGINLENTAGYKWLNDLIWKGAWSGLGIMTSGYWISTGQRVIQVGIPRSATDTKLDEIATVLTEEVVPVLTPGALSTADDQKLKKDYGDAQVIDVFDDDCSETHDYKIMILKTGEVHVTNTRYYRYSGDSATIYKGDLRGALTVVRNTLPYGE